MKNDSIALKAYNEIRRKILTQQLLPDTRLKEDEWARKIDVSRVAIREALHRLLGEGLVKTGEKGGYFVMNVTADDVKMIRELREVLETGAMRLFHKKKTRERIEELEEICNDFSLMVKQGYLNGAREADMKFHETLVKGALNSKLLEIYRLSHIPLFHHKLGKALTEINDYEQTDKEHRKIVVALKSDNLKLAEQTLIKHFARGEAVVLDIE